MVSISACHAEDPGSIPGSGGYPKSTIHHPAFAIIIPPSLGPPHAASPRHVIRVGSKPRKTMAIIIPPSAGPPHAASARHSARVGSKPRKAMHPWSSGYDVSLTR